MKCGVPAHAQGTVEGKQLKKKGDSLAWDDSTTGPRKGESNSLNVVKRNHWRRKKKTALKENNESLWKKIGPAGVSKIPKGSSKEKGKPCFIHDGVVDFMGFRKGTREKRWGPSYRKNEVHNSHLKEGKGKSSQKGPKPAKGGPGGGEDGGLCIEWESVQKKKNGIEFEKERRDPNGGKKRNGFDQNVHSKTPRKAW